MKAASLNREREKKKPSFQTKGLESGLLRDPETRFVDFSVTKYAVKPTILRTFLESAQKYCLREPLPPQHGFWLARCFRVAQTTKIWREEVC